MLNWPIVPVYRSGNIVSMHPSQLKGPAKKYVAVKDELCVCENILLRSSRLIIPESLRDDILKTLHAGHQGITKCRERASRAVWWPGISKDIYEAIQQCVICCKTRFQPAEPLLPSPFPDYPW